MTVPALDTPAATLDIAALQRELQARTPDEPVRLLETHVSWVLLAGTIAYKLKKPVRLGFVDFTTRASRQFACEEELRLNRRLAPGLYIDVVAVRDTPDGPSLARGTGPVIDHAVRMRRFDDGALFSERLVAGALSAAHVDRLAARLAAFHEAAPVADPTGPYGTPAAVAAALHGVLESLAAHVATAELAPFDDWAAATVPRLQAAWRERLDRGRVREGHGDLHLANVALVDGEVVAFDCIEFDPALRWIDVIADLAFVAMDFIARGRSDLAFRCLDGWLERTGDHAGLAVLGAYMVERALVRALVGRLDPARAARGPDYLAAARALAAPGDARLLIAHGVSGSGKSFVAQRLLEQAGAVRIRSDVERKRLHGLSPLQRSAAHVPAGIYGAEATRRTFDTLHARARVALEAGYPTIVDAAFLHRDERERFRALAAALGVPFTILHCHAPVATLRQRVDQRWRQGRDASEADIAVLERQLAALEPLAEDEQAAALEADTGLPVDVAELARRWRAAR